MKKILLAILIISVLAFAACSNNQNAADSDQNTEVDAVQNTDVAVNNTLNETQQDTEETNTKYNDNEYVLMIRGSVIEPDTIYLKKDMQATLTIIDENSEFAFTIPGIEIDEITQGPASVDLIFTPEEPGTYNLVCVTGCAAGTEFDGLIIVE